MPKLDITFVQSRADGRAVPHGTPTDPHGSPREPHGPHGTGGRTDGRTGGRTDGRTDGRADGRTGGRADGRTGTRHPGGVRGLHKIHGLHPRSTY